jgi:uncharacterized membrane protein YvbJ
MLLKNFRRNLLKLVFKTIYSSKPKSMKSLFNDEVIEKLMVYAETICQALSYLETAKVVLNMSKVDKKKLELFHDYHKLVLPRFAAIYQEWK